MPACGALNKGRSLISGPREEKFIKLPLSKGHLFDDFIDNIFLNDRIIERADVSGCQKLGMRRRNGWV